MTEHSHVNPFKLEGSWFKGNLHTHTLNSDGALTVEEAYSIYKLNDYDFLFITDHRKVTDIHTFQNDPSFLILNGTELDLPSSEVGTRYHIIGLNISEVIDANDPQDAISDIQSQGGVALIAHPYWSALSVKDLMELDGYIGIEIFNSHCHLSRSKGYSTVHWDDLLLRGRQIFGFAVDDCHWHFNDRPFDGCYAWISVKASKLDLNSLISSISNGLFYSSNGPEIYDLTVNENLVSIVTSPAKAISFITFDGKGFRFNAVDGFISHASFPLDKLESYVRVEVEDAVGHVAWTNPIYL